jgi:hypothetical protein
MQQKRNTVNKKENQKRPKQYNFWLLGRADLRFS